jgi:hypothetical protein
LETLSKETMVTGDQYTGRGRRRYRAGGVKGLAGAA